MRYLLLLLLLAGCASSPESYWTRTGKPLPLVEMLDVAEPRLMPLYCPNYPRALACAERDASSCKIFFNASHRFVRDEKSRAEIAAHELCHCKGFDHDDLGHDGAVACPE